MKTLMDSPEVRGFAKSTVEKLGDNPVPKIIQLFTAGEFTAENQVTCRILLCYIGESAIPHLIKLLGHDNQWTAKFGA